MFNIFCMSKSSSAQKITKIAQNSIIRKSVKDIKLAAKDGQFFTILDFNEAYKYRDEEENNIYSFLIKALEEKGFTVKGYWLDYFTFRIKVKWEE